MEKIKLNLNEMNQIAEMLNYKVSNKVGVMTLKDGSRMTTELHIFEIPEGPVFLNLSNATTFKFEDKESFDKYITKKFQLYKNDKEMYMDFCGMSEEDWKVWNSESEE